MAARKEKEKQGSRSIFGKENRVKREKKLAIYSFSQFLQGNNDQNALTNQSNFFLILSSFTRQPKHPSNQIFSGPHSCLGLRARILVSAPGISPGLYRQIFQT